MEHSFDVEIATKYGIEEAILFKNIVYWVKKNEANKQNYFNNCYWTYNSMKAYQKLFPYMTERQIRYALDKLIKEELIIKGEYNQARYDRTSWYSIGKKGQEFLKEQEQEPELPNENCQMEMTKLSNGVDKIVKSSRQNCQVEMTKLSNGVDKIVEPIPNINTYINTDIKQTNINSDNIATTAPAEEDTTSQKIIETLDKYMPMANRTFYDTLNNYDLQDDLKIYAIKECAMNNKRTASYLKAILENIKNQGYQSVEEVEQAQEEYKKKKRSKSNDYLATKNRELDIREKELELKKANQPFYQQQVKMQYDRENSSRYMAETLREVAQKEHIEQLSGEVPRQIERTLPTRAELLQMGEEERKRVIDSLSMDELNKMKERDAEEEKKR